MEDRNYIVYLHINKINGKVYVGITSLNINNRWRRGNGYKKCSIMNNAIQKYGWNNFYHIVLCKTSKDKAILLEKSLIKIYKKKKISYNISGGGEGAGEMSEETKQKLRLYRGEKSSMYGKHPSKETITKRVLTRKKLNNYCRDMPWLTKYRLRKGKNNPLYGKKPSENTLKAHRKPVLQFNLNGTFIKEYASIKEASLAINISSSAILHCIKNITNKAGGYKWKYKI